MIIIKDSGNILDNFQYIDTQVKGLKEEYQQNYLLDGEELDSWVCVPVSALETEDYVNYDSVFWDDDDWLDFLHSTHKGETYNKYLVVAYGNNWRGANGYKFVEGHNNLLSYDYDVSIYHMAHSKEKKVNIYNVSAHDYPMGSHLIVIGLTHSEYKRLEYAQFDTVMTFAQTYMNKYTRNRGK